MEDLGFTAAAWLGIFLAAAKQKSAEMAVEGTTGALVKLSVWLRHRFSGRQELAVMEAAPDSATATRTLGEAIDAELVDDDTARTQLTTLLEGVKAEDPSTYSQVITQTIKGNDNVQASHSTVTINRER